MKINKLRFYKAVTACGIAAMMSLSACGPDGQAVPRAGAFPPSRAVSVGGQSGQAAIDLHGDTIRFAADERPVVRVGLLLPITHDRADVTAMGNALLNSAQLALFEANNAEVVLIPKDTYGTPKGAEAAAQAAIAEGAEVILGPLFSGSVKTAGAVARANDVPMIAFSTDRTVAGDGVYLLSFLPEQEVKRITDFASSEGMFAFAALIPISAYGDRVRNAFQHNVDRSGGVITIMEAYPRVAEEMFGPAKTVAEYDRRQRALKERKDGASTPAPQGDEPGTSLVFDPVTGTVMSAAEARQKGIYTGQQTWGGVSYQAVLLPEGGTLLRSLAPLLPYFDVDPREVKFLGTGLWDDADLGKEPSLVGGWYAAPSPAMRTAFSERYEAAFGKQPPRIASLSFDAVALTSALARLPREQRFSPVTLGNPNGFAGIDGIFRFLPDGSAERGLAVVQVNATGIEVISPAPRTFQSLDTVLDDMAPVMSEPAGGYEDEIQEYGY